MIRSKRGNRIIAMFLAFLMFISVFAIIIDATLPSVSANTQAEIDRLRGVKRELDRQRQNVQSRIDDIEFDRLTTVAQKEVLDDRIMLTWQEIESVSEVIALYEILIIEKEIEVTQAQIRENEQLENYRARVRSMEENGIITYLEILFDSTSFADLLARWDFVGDIMRADERAYADLVAAREETQAAEEALKLTKEGLEAEKEQLEIRERELEEQIVEANALIEQIMDTLEGERALYQEVAAEARSIQAEINRLVEQQRREEEERRRREREAQARRAAERTATQGPRVTGTGQLMWPASGPVTSGFGNRTHPVFGGTRFHAGIDIGASHGASVVAADSGVVIVSTFNSSYGHFIVINHGNGMTTLYAHLSARLVSVGQSVSRGQLIGRVGSTGVSTGPHLHFEVSINGTRVNPLNHL